MSTRRPKLKPVEPEAVLPVPEVKTDAKAKAPVGSHGRVAMSVYLNPEAYEQLKQLGVVKRAKAAELLREGLNKVFVENGLPPVA